MRRTAAAVSRRRAVLEAKRRAAETTRDRGIDELMKDDPSLGGADAGDVKGTTHGEGTAFTGA
jgi:hypothetical protein